MGSVELGKLADLVLWKPAFFGVKPELVLKGGLIAWAAMGDPNASIPTPQPVLYRPMFASFGRATARTSVTFVSKAALASGVPRSLGLRRRTVAVSRCRGLGKRDMVQNDALPRIEVTPRPTRSVRTASGSPASRRRSCRWPSGTFSSEALLIVVDRVLEGVDAGALAGRERDTLRLTWEGRRWARQVKTSGGREVALALPTGTVLAIGAILCLEPGFYLAVEGEPEPVIAVRPRDQREALRVAFEVGNRHFSLAQDGEALLVPDDSAMTQLLDRLAVPWERRAAVYSPLGFTHDHGH